MSDVEELDDRSTEGKQSRRAIFKDALSRTRTKFKKSDNPNSKDFKLSDDVNDFLAAGRITTPTKPSFDTSSPPATSNASTFLHSQPSPRGISVPRLDLSTSTRFPGARVLEDEVLSHGEEFLRPYEKYQRSQSVSSFKKRRTKPRNLSVSFENTAPVVIGEGGDEAEMPVVEISRARHRTRSLSPMARRPISGQSNSSMDISGIRRKPLPPMIQTHNESDFRPKPLRRAQTGLEESTRSVAGREYDQILQSPSFSGSDSISTPLYSPTPVRPSVGIPSVDNHVSYQPQPPKNTPQRPNYSPPRMRSAIVDSDTFEQGTVQVMLTEENDHNYRNRLQQRNSSPTIPNGFADPNPKTATTTTTMIPQYTIPYREQPTMSGNKATGHGVGGWL